MSTNYLGINYWPQNVNFYETDVIELAEAQYGIKASAAIGKLICKIYKEGYYIPWGNEQSMIFARKLGGEINAKEMAGIMKILLDKGFFDREMYEQHHILTSLDIQNVWMEATNRRKKNWDQLLYMMLPAAKTGAPAPKPANNKEEKAGDSPENADISKENADIFLQSKEKKSKELKEEDSNASPLIQIPEYAYNPATHNLKGLQENLARLRIVHPQQVNAILRLSDYGRLGTLVWMLLAHTEWPHIKTPGNYIITSLSNQRK